MFLRKGWCLFPLMGLLASLAWGGPFWRWVEGRSPWPLDWTRLLSPQAWVLAASMACIPLLWYSTRRLHLRRGMGLVLGVILAFGMDAFLRLPRMQTPLWLASRARLQSGQFFMREVCYVRLEEAVGRAVPSPALVLIGSSQVLHGVDDELLRDLISPTPVIRRATFGLTPLKALAMMDYVPFQAEDVCFQYLSEFDFTNQDPFPAAWFRPYATPRTFAWVMPCVAPKVKWLHWRQVVDYAMASVLESWRSRDFFRQILFHFWQADTTAGTGVEDGEQAVQALVAQARRKPVPSPAEWRAFLVYSDILSAMGVHQWVFEGEVHPALRSSDRLAVRAVVRTRLRDLLSEDGARYVSRQSQGLVFDEESWLDMTHLNASGREQLTRRIAAEWAKP